MLKVCTFFSLGLRLLCQQCVQDGQQERSRLTAASLTGHHQVDKACCLVSRFVALHSQRDGLLLYGSRLSESEVFDRVNQLGSQAESQKAIGCLIGIIQCRGHCIWHFCRWIGKIFDKRNIARRQNSVSHEFTHTRALQGMQLLRQWLKNINHQTEPARTQDELFSAGGPFLRNFDNETALDPVNEGDVQNAPVFSMQPAIMAQIRVST